MKLLIITQKVDINDPILGFFHRWIIEFAKYAEKITVICLEKGQYDLPNNVKVLSLGKENGRSRLKYIWRFYKYIWQERKNYDKVFVHMNQEYILLGGLIWKVLRKKVSLWRNHKFGNLLTSLAVFLSDQVFYTSEFSYTAKFKKTSLMPVGIDTNLFSPDPNIKKIPRSILSLGRISRVKRLDILIKALVALKLQGLIFKATVVGSAISDDDQDYEKELYLMAEPLIKSSMLEFIPGVPQDSIVNFFRTHEIFVNLTPAGSMDKTIFEAMACEMIVVVDNNNMIKDLEKKLIYYLQLDQNDKIKIRQENRQVVINNHGLNLLAQSLTKTFLKN